MCGLWLNRTCACIDNGKVPVEHAQAEVTRQEHDDALRVYEAHLISSEERNKRLTQQLADRAAQVKRLHADKGQARDRLGQAYSKIDELTRQLDHATTENQRLKSELRAAQEDSNGEDRPWPKFRSLDTLVVRVRTTGTKVGAALSELPRR
jgi:predicted RNase H-like nuclease (RuvC/YqgF family)